MTTIICLISILRIQRQKSREIIIMGANSSALSPESQDKTSPIYQNQTSTKKDVDSSHGNGDAKPADPENKPKCKPCCACPETKRARDACIVENGEENCQDLIEAHRECMRKEGFNI